MSKLGDPMKRKWIPLGSPQAVLLLVSLCLNVLMGSYIAKQWFENWSRPVGLANEPRLIQFIADRLAIINHISAYAYLMDEGRWED